MYGVKYILTHVKTTLKNIYIFACISVHICMRVHRHIHTPTGRTKKINHDNNQPNTLENMSVRRMYKWLYVHVFVYMYTWIYVHVSVCVYTWSYVYVYECMYNWFYVHMFVCKYTWLYVHVFMCVQTIIRAWLKGFKYSKLLNISIWLISNR